MFSFVKKLITRAVFPNLRSSFAQSGEDIIICDLFTRLNIEKPSYIDIGANDPVSLSNTYRLYKRGSRGVCIEPNPVLAKKIRRKRKGDKVINAGVAFDEKKEADYYLFAGKAHGLNTFSKKEADYWANTGNDQVGKFQIAQAIKTQLFSLNEIILSNFDRWPNLITIDVEGLDLPILKTLDFNSIKSEVICAETLNFSTNNKESKNEELITFINSKGYFLYADTYINSIFCRQEAYPNRTS